MIAKPGFQTYGMAFFKKSVVKGISDRCIENEKFQGNLNQYMKVRKFLQKGTNELRNALITEKYCDVSTLGGSRANSGVLLHTISQNSANF